MNKRYEKLYKKFLKANEKQQTIMLSILSNELKQLNVVEGLMKEHLLEIINKKEQDKRFN